MGSGLQRRFGHVALCHEVHVRRQIFYVLASFTSPEKVRGATLCLFNAAPHLHITRQERCGLALMRTFVNDVRAVQEA